MTKTPRLSSLPHRLGVAGPARVRAFKGTGAPFAILLALGVLAVSAAPALANGGHAYERALGLGPGEGAGQLDLVAPSKLEYGFHVGDALNIAGSGVAVEDETHDVYVADTGNHRVDEFDPTKPPSEQFMRAWGFGVADGLSMFETCGPDALIATCKAGLEGSNPGELSAPKFVAVDNAPGPSHGDVYVGDGVGTQAVNELQYLEFSEASEGTYTLTLDYNGKDETTKPIVYVKSAFDGNEPENGPNAKAAQTALEGLASIGPGNVSVEEEEEVNSKLQGNGEAGGLIIEFVGALAQTAVPRLTSAGAVDEVKVVRLGSKFSGEVISKFTAEGALVESWGDTTPTPNGQLTGKEASGGPFGIAKVKVELPLQLPSRLTTLQKACTDKQFEANPAGCPSASKIGYATVHTPILPGPLTGPAIFVSHGGEAFPSLTMVLQGNGITIDLVGATFISHSGITSTTFKTVPDSPFSTFELTLPEGPYSALAANGNLCASKLVMPNEFVGQNGAVIKRDNDIVVEGCKPAIYVTSHKVKNKTATLEVSVPAAGKLVATSKGLSKASKTAKGATTLTVKLSLSNSEKAFLAKHKGRKLKATIKLQFTPKKGSKLKTTVNVLIG